MLIASVMPWRIATRALDARMQRTPVRSRLWVVVSASLYAFFSFAAVQLVYDWELDRKGLHRAGFQPAHVFRNTVEIHLVGFLVWWFISIVTAFLIQRFQRQLSAALLETRRQASELALISDVGAATTAPLPRQRIAGEFLTRVRWATTGCVTAVLVRNDGCSFAVDAISGQREGDPRQAESLSRLPSEVASRLERFDHVVVNGGLSALAWWQEVRATAPWLPESGAALLLPLVSRKQLVGVWLLGSAVEGVFPEDRVRLVRSLSHYLAGALDNAELVSDAEARAAREQQINIELQRLNQAKSEFVSMVAHEFRTPLTGIQGFSEIIRDYELSLEEIREYASDINSDARRLGRMINAQLDLDRMTSGKFELAREPVDLNALATDLVDHIAPFSPEHRVELQLAADLPAIDGDRDRLIQVASNLLNNAVKYSPGGGLVRVATSYDDEAVELMVCDQGVGIAREDVERVFQPYTRVERSNVAQVAGTGLGLPIVRQIVDLHGGRVWVESELGKGSTFRVRLPRRHQPVGASGDGGDRRLRRRSHDPKALSRGTPADAT